MKRNIQIIFSAGALGLLSGMVTSLLSARALGPAGRGDLAIILLWPGVFAMLVALGIPQANRYWVARQPESVSALFSNAVIFTLIAGLAALGLAELIVPHLISERNSEVMTLVRIFNLKIPAALLCDLMIGLLQGGRRFRWVGVIRGVFPLIQVGIYLALWLGGGLTVWSAALTLLGLEVGTTLFSVSAVWYEFRPRWQPRWAAWKMAFGYAIRYYPGILTSFTTLRLDQMMLSGMASSVAIGLYYVAVRLSEITTVLASSVADAVMPEVAASERAKDAVQLLFKSLRLTLYTFLVALIPLWIGAPIILRVAYGTDFLAAAGTLRLLFLASMIWSASAIVISGLNGFGHPGLVTISRLVSAVVTVAALLLWLPSRGIVGAALASLAGYGAMLVVALYGLVHRQQINLWECLRPRWDDFPIDKLKSNFRFRFLKSRNSEA